MLLKSDQTNDPTIFEEWPKHYYEISDPEARGNCLRKILQAHPDSADDRRRLALYEGRFVKGKNGWADLYMRAWIELQVAADMRISRLNFKKRQADYRKGLSAFGLTDELPDAILLAEWKDFAREYIEACAESRSYRTVALGFGKMSDETVAKKIIKDIWNIMMIVPKKLELDALCAPLRTVMLEVYAEMIVHGQEYLHEVLEKNETTKS